MIASTNNMLVDETKRTGLLDHLSDELIVLVLSWVPPIDLLSSTALVSKRLSALVRDECFWQNHSLLPDRLIKSESLNVHQLKRVCLFAAASNNRSAAAPPSCLHLGSCLASNEEAVELRTRTAGALRACVASTTEYSTELIENVLVDSAVESRIENEWNALPMPARHLPPLLRPGRTMSTWWSSRPSETQDTNEVLMFATKCPDTLISQVAIKPLRDPFNGEIVYTWKNTVIKVYKLFPPQLNNRGFPCAIRAYQSSPIFRLPALWLSVQRHAPPDQETIDSLLSAGRTPPVYESSVLPGPSSNAWESFSLPAGVVGNVVSITLVGKHHRQFQSSGFYACVEQVFVRGIPLYTNPDRQMRNMEEEHAAADT